MKLGLFKEEQQLCTTPGVVLLLIEEGGQSELTSCPPSPSSKL
jgi:hypothetical protein